MSEASYTFFDHAADVGVEVRAGSLEELFVAAGLALMEWMGPQPAAGRRGLRDVDVGAEDLESLLVKWLRELHFLFQHRQAYFVGTRSLVLSPTEARARA